MPKCDLGNIKHGVVLTGSGVTGNTVLGNLIGTERDRFHRDRQRQRWLRDRHGSEVQYHRRLGRGRGQYDLRQRSDGSILVQAKLNTIQGNKIGTDSDGNAALGNGSHGILVTNKTSDTLIGGINAGNGNVIANNARFGVLIGSIRPMDSPRRPGMEMPCSATRFSRTTCLGSV